MTTATAVANHLNIVESAIAQVEEWASVLFVRFVKGSPRFVSKKIDIDAGDKEMELPLKGSEMKKITLEQAQELTGDNQAILRGYITPEVINYAYKIIEEKAKKGIFDSRNGCGNPHQYWLENFESYREMSEAFPEGGRNTRKYARCCELVDKVTLILYQDLSFEEARDTI